MPHLPGFQVQYCDKERKTEPRSAACCAGKAPSTTRIKTILRLQTEARSAPKANLIERCVARPTPTFAFRRMGSMASKARIKPTQGMEPKAKAINFSTTNSDSDSESVTKWPCANCHSVVHVQDERCPMCQGVQVKVKIPPEFPVVQKRFFERCSPATVTVTPLRERLVVMVDTATTANTSVSLTEFEDDDDLSVSVGSPEHDIIFEVDLRPTDPVAVTLAAESSPLPGQTMGIDSMVAATLITGGKETKRKSAAFETEDLHKKKPKTSTEAAHVG